MKILVTGSTGFIGKNLSLRLVLDGNDVYGIVRKPGDISVLRSMGVVGYVDNGNDSDLTNFFNEHKFDGVIHLATYYISSHSSEYIKKMLESNILFPTRVLDSAVKSGVRWFINTGTFAQNYKNMDHSPINLYAATKQSFESISEYYSKYCGIDFVTLKLHSAYGPGDTRNKILNTWLKIADTDTVIDMSPGGQYVDMVHITDVVSAFCLMSKLIDGDSFRNYNGKCFGIISNDKITLKGMADLFCKVTGKKLNINWGALPYRDREVMTPISGIEPVPGWKPEINLEHGMGMEN